MAAKSQGRWLTLTDVFHQRKSPAIICNCSSTTGYDKLPPAQRSEQQFSTERPGNETTISLPCSFVFYPFK